jgi:hypothetical protein
MGVVEAAWLAGEVGEAQVRLLAAARTSAVAECFARDESMLVAQAKTLRYGAFARCVAYWGQLADPEGSDRSAEAALRRREPAGGGATGPGVLPPLLRGAGGGL